MGTSGGAVSKSRIEANAVEGSPERELCGSSPAPGISASVILCEKSSKQSVDFSWLKRLTI